MHIEFCEVQETVLSSEVNTLKLKVVFYQQWQKGVQHLKVQSREENHYRAMKRCPCKDEERWKIQRLASSTRIPNGTPSSPKFRIRLNEVTLCKQGRNPCMLRGTREGRPHHLTSLNLTSCQWVREAQPWGHDGCQLRIKLMLPASAPPRKAGWPPRRCQIWRPEHRVALEGGDREGWDARPQWWAAVGRTEQSVEPVDLGLPSPVPLRGWPWDLRHHKDLLDSGWGEFRQHHED